MNYWLKLVGSGTSPLTGKDYRGIYDVKQVGFRKARLPDIRKGDRIVLYAPGGSKSVFALAEAISNPTQDKACDPRKVGSCQWKVRLEYEYNLPVTSGVSIDQISTPSRNLVKSLRQQSHIKLTKAEFNLAERKLRKQSALKDEFDDEMLSLYQKTGKETGYWGKYFLRSVRKHGGLVTAKRTLEKGTANQEGKKGFQALVEAGRPDLMQESVVLQPKYRPLFTRRELRDAGSRLKTLPRYAKRIDVSPERNYPDELADERECIEGAKKQVTVNAYERDPRARRACVRYYGYKCQVCGMEFSRTYGPIGRKFIHVHHKIPLAARQSNYRVNPLKDLIPVCPNCHAMLHSKKPPLGAEELKRRMDARG